MKPRPEQVSLLAEARGELLRMDGAAKPAPEPPPSDSFFARSPSATEIREAGLFARPAMVPSGLGTEAAVSVDAFMGAVKTRLDRAHAAIGGRLTLDPYWKCWSSTPTARLR